MPLPKPRLWDLGEEYIVLNPPPVRSYFREERVFEEVIDNDRWMSMGHVPVPQSTLGWFVYHFFHGLLMRYPLWAVILFCFDKDNYPSRLKGG